MKKFIVTTCLINILGLASLAAQTNFSSASITTTNGKTYIGEISIELLDKEGILVFRNSEGLIIEYEASQLEKAKIINKITLTSKSIIYNISSTEEAEDSFFVETLIEGRASLEKVFAAEFTYALTKFDETKALQKIILKTGNDPTVLDSYKGVMYLTFRDCGEGINTNDIQLKRKDLYFYINQYNSCLDPTKKFERRVRKVFSRSEVEINVGIHNASIKFMADHPFFDDFYISDYDKSSEISYGMKFRSSLWRDKVYIGFGFQKNAYAWIHKEDERIRRAPKLTSRELMIPFQVEGRFRRGRIEPAFFSGINLHIITKHHSGGRIVEQYPEGVTSFTRNFRLIDDLKLLKDEYFSFTGGASISYILTNSWDVGFTLLTHLRKEEIFSHRVPGTDEKISKDLGLRVHIKYKIINLK